MTDLTEIWAKAEAEFPAADNYGIQVERHTDGFYIGQIQRIWGEGETRRFHILAYCNKDTPAASLAQAIVEARRSLRAGIDWARGPLPGFEEEAA